MGEELNQNLFVDDQGALSAGADDEICVSWIQKRHRKNTNLPPNPVSCNKTTHPSPMSKYTRQSQRMWNPDCASSNSA
jgi:hypothetical protein